VNPKNQQEEQLPGEREVRRHHPKLVEHRQVANLTTILELAESDTDSVRHEQEWNCQPEGQLPRFICWHTQMPASVKRIKAEEPVRDKSGIKHHHAGISLPRRQQHGARGLHGTYRPNAESVIDQVRCRKRE
jgi:hypothetical protein